MSSKTLSLAALATAALLATGWALAADPVDPASPMPPAAAPAGKAAKAGKPMSKLDANGDGSVSREEAQSHSKLAGQFDSLDTDKDGRLSTTEMQAHKDQHVGKRGKMDKAGKHGKAAEMDTNGDQLISREEAAKNPKMARHFDLADTNKDGQLSTDEIAAARQSRGK